MDEDQQTAPIDAAHKDNPKLPLTDETATNACCTIDDAGILQFFDTPASKNNSEGTSKNPGIRDMHNGSCCTGAESDSCTDGKNKTSRFEFEDLFDGLDTATSTPAASSGIDGQRPFSCKQYEKNAGHDGGSGPTQRSHERDGGSSDYSSISRLKNMLELPADGSSANLAALENGPKSEHSMQGVAGNPTSSNKGVRSHNQTVENENASAPREMRSEDPSAAAFSKSKPPTRAGQLQEQPVASEVAAYEPMGEFAPIPCADYADNVVDPRYRKRRYVEERLFSAAHYGAQESYLRGGCNGWNDGYGGGVADYYASDYRPYNSGFDGSLRNMQPSYSYHGQGYSNWNVDCQPGAYTPQGGCSSQAGATDMERDQGAGYGACPDARGHLYRQPYEASSLGPFYGFRKKRRNNPSMWSMSHTKRDAGQTMPPSKYSSLEFIQGMVNRKAFMGPPAHAPEKSRNNYMLPTIIESLRPLNGEQAAIVGSFKAEVIQLDLENITVFQLKSLMKEYGLNHSGKKSELIEIVKDAYGKASKFDLAVSDSSPAKTEQPAANKGLEYDKYFF